MSLDMDNLLSEVEAASGLDELRLAQEKLRVLFDVERYKRETEKFELDKTQIESRKKLDGIRSLTDLEKNGQSFYTSSELKKLRKIIKTETNLEEGNLDNIIYLIPQISGGDEKNPPGIINNGEDYLNVIVTAKMMPSLDYPTITQFNGS